MIDGGGLGTLMHAESAFSHDKLINVPRDNWRTRKSVSPAAGMTGMGIHLTDLYIWMFGRVQTVQALTADRSLGWETGDVVTVQLGFETGMTASLSAILHTPHFMRFHVFGSTRWVELRNDTHPDTPGGIARMEIQSSDTGAEHSSFAWIDTVDRNLNAFADAIEETVPYRFTPEEMVHNIEVLEAIALSAERGETVSLQTSAIITKRSILTVEKLDRRETQYRVTDVFQIMGHRFPACEVEMPGIPLGVVHIDHLAVTIPRTRLSGSRRAPHVIQNMGVKRQAITGLHGDQPDIDPVTGADQLLPDPAVGAGP